MNLSIGATAVHMDPRRPGRRAMAAVTCWCGRFYTLTGEEVQRHARHGTRPCPNPECGKGDQ